MRAFLIVLWLVDSTYQDGQLQYERQRYDGWYNNRAHPDWGSKGSRLNRKTPAAYWDGVYMMGGQNRPSPRDLSDVVSKGLDGKGSLMNRTALLAFFGQLVTSEILMASEAHSCPLEFTRIQIAKCDEMYDAKCGGEMSMPFYRAPYDRSTGQSPNSPREQKNHMTAWIDGSFIYSTLEPWADIMRQFQDGKLKMTEEGYPPFNTEGVPLHNFPVPHLMKAADPTSRYLLGDPRVHQNPAILTFGILFYRWHNVLADRVKRSHPSWSDEDIFQSARRLNIASLQNIIAYEYIPAFTGDSLDPYTGYKPDVSPGISHVFQSAAFRFGHTLIPPGIYQRGPGSTPRKTRTSKKRDVPVSQERTRNVPKPQERTCNFLPTRDGSPALRLCSSWWNAQDEVYEDKVENILRGLSSQISEKEDSTLCADIRNKLFGPLDFSRRDLAALNIMRGRDSGLPDYNTVRMYFGLRPAVNWSDINPGLYKAEPEVFYRLEELYGSQGIQDLDLYIGGMLESDHGPGPLFRSIIRDQFERLRDGDRFWFENKDNDIFSDEEVEAIRKITLWDVIVNATNVDPKDIQKQVFFWEAGDPCPQPSQLSHQDMKPCIHHQKFDYFMGSEVAYIYGILLIVVFPLLVVFVAYLCIKYSNAERKRIKAAKRHQKENKTTSDKMYVREMQKPDSYRFVKARFGPGSVLQTVDRKGNVITKIDFIPRTAVLVKVNIDRSDEYLVLIKTKDYHDMVFSFDTSQQRKKFIAKVESLLAANSCRMETLPTDAKSLVNSAETKAKREERLEHFFREAYAVTFGIDKTKKQQTTKNFGSAEVMSINLTREEFASALGMKPNDIFVRKMFKIVDSEKNGRISFKNFLDTVVLFTKGGVEDKLRIIYDMCDEDSRGVVDKSNFKEMLTSLIDIAKTDKIHSADVSDLIGSMFKTAGLEDRDSITYQDFQKLMAQFKGDLLSVGLDCKGAHKNFLDTNSNVARMDNFKLQDEEEHGACKSSCTERWDSIVGYLEENRQNIFYLVVFYTITFGLFIERFMHFSFMSEHTDLRKIMGVGIAITRGSAGALTFCYSLLLLTVSRNLITKLKELSLHQYIPLDLHIQFHKICACTALFFSLLHTAGHLVNFYHVSTQPSEHLKCMSREIHIPPGVTPNITYWLFNTITGLTGLALYCIMVIIFTFSYTPVRKQAFKFFWMTHQLYILLYFLNLIHGLARITQEPKFWIFVVGPGIIYTLDTVISLRRSYMQLDILETKLLPSDVIQIKFYRPPNFKFLSGQYVKLSCTALQPEQFHSLTITSAPHEDFLSVHVKAIGAWTWRLRNYFDPLKNPETDVEDVDLETATTVSGTKAGESRRPSSDPNRPPSKLVPRIRIQGPYGGGNQDWYKYEVAVMIGAGIGVTPYASILNDLVFGTSTNRYSGVACKKVYFVWICPSHRHFEWFIDVLREVERKDVTKVLEMHIFITQFFHKFDLRTTMLYICENHFQQLSRRSLFTGLRAQNHFGRPDMQAFLRFVQRKHSYVNSIGVFSCGPRVVVRANSSACEMVNRNRKHPYFQHHFEHFG